MKVRSLKMAALAALALVGIRASAAPPPSHELDGRWAATTVQGGVTIPFRLDLSSAGGRLVGTLYNGEDKDFTTSASLSGDQVELNFEHYLLAIVATVKDGELDGRIESRRGGQPNGGSPFHAKRYIAPTASETSNVPAIGGDWEMAHESAKGEKAWRLIVKQSGAEITAAILRVDGDTGALTGNWQGDKFIASHFDGARPGVIVLTPRPDGALEVELSTNPRLGKMLAYRPDVARAKGLPEPANYGTHTSVRDPGEVFQFRFPDVSGKVVTNEDARFKNKVVLVTVTGTWCPNCHDEVRYLVELYAKYHDRGLEIVALDFEEPEQQSTLRRVNAFIKRYQIRYPYLIAGAPAEVLEKLPQAVNLNTWPATFFLGHDGKVKATHAGFAGPASGPFYEQLKQEFTSTVERLLQENAPSARQ